MCYPFVRKILFQMDPEKAHAITLKSLNLAHHLGITKLFPSPSPSSWHTVMGLPFSNPIGLAAGFDKNGEYIDALATLGFGFLEIGTVTPQPQEGSPSPRLFRLPKEEALINRLGFNNKGIDYLVAHVKKASFKGILGINIGKNRTTPLTEAIDDYLYCFRRAASIASYITVNISSPNTPELRDLQQGDLLKDLLRALKKEQTLFAKSHKKYVPLVIKIAPDLSSTELQTMAETLLAEKMDAVIATNTTISREAVPYSPLSSQAGGLSGKPLSKYSTEIIKNLYHYLQGKIPIIASGGVMSEQDALDKISAGAVLVQIHTGLIYRGPFWVRRLVKRIIAEEKK